MKFNSLKLFVGISLILTLIMSLVFSGCAKQQVSPTTSAQPGVTTPVTAPTTSKPAVTTPGATTPAATSVTPTTAPSVAIAKTTLRYGHYFPPGDFRDLTAHYFADLIEKNSNGIITIKIYPAEQIVKGSDGFTAVAGGVVDLYPVASSYAAGKVPLIDIFNIPLPAHNDEGTAKIIREAMPILDPVFQSKNTKLLCTVHGTGYNEMFFSKPLRTLPDLKGVKIRAGGGMTEKALIKLGMSVVNLSAAEQYMALQTKTIDGCTTSYMSIISYKLYEVAPYWVRVDVCGSQPYLLVLNLNKWNKLSPEAQKIVNDAAADTEKWYFSQFNQQLTDLQNQLRAKMKEEIIPSKEESSLWRAQLSSLLDEFLAINGADGKALKAVVDKIDNE